MNENAPIRKSQRQALLGGIFLASICVIAFEITISRLLSVLLSYHYVFLVLSLALLGLGTGGMFVYFFRPQVAAEQKNSLSLSFVSAMFSLAISFSVILIIQIGYIHNIKITVLLYCLILIFPFLLAGALFAEIFRMFPSISNMIYGTDLIGAAAGSLIIIPLLNTLDAVSTCFVLGAVASISAVFFAIRDMKKNHKGLIIPFLSFSILFLLLVLNLAGGLKLDMHIGSNPAKEIYDALSSFKGKVIETKWSSFGRTDLIEFDDYPDHMDLYIDGTAGSPMYRFNGDVNAPGTAIEKLQKSYPGYFPFVHLQEKEKNSALVIGSGGGRDILLALMGGLQEITAVEINSALVNTVRRYSKYNGGIYTDSEKVTTVVDEGRSFLRRQKEQYDIIMLNLPVTNTSRSLEGYSLTENFIFTTGSINDYLDHLTDEGRLVVVGHNDAEVLRLLSISLTALKERGVDTVTGMSRIFITGTDEYLVFVLKKAPFEPSRALEMYKDLPSYGLDPALSYFPFIRQAGAVNPAFLALANGHLNHEEFIKMIKERGYDISPVTDDSPFFYKFETGIPKPVFVVFLSSVILMIMIILIPLLFRKRVSPQGKTKKESRERDILKPVLLFSLLGTGFVLVEISLIQRFVFFLGYPVMSLAVLLGSLLGGGGIGSLWSGRLSPDNTCLGISMSSLSIIVIIICYIFLLPVIFERLLGLDLVIRVLSSVCILIPVGFVMGIPFPLGIRLLKEKRLENHIPWMWGINGAGSVLGSVLTIVIAMSFGFTEAFLVSAVCYFIIFLSFSKN